MTKPQQDDKQQIGLTAEADEMIRELASKYFPSQTDAYRFAIMYSIAAGLDPSTAAQSGYQTKYAAMTTLESGTSLRDVLEILEVGDQERPFATAEKMADLGVKEIFRRLQGSEGIADILSSVSSVTQNDDTEPATPSR